MFYDTNDGYANVVVKSEGHFSLGNFAVNELVELFPGDSLSTVATHSVNDIL